MIGRMRPFYQTHWDISKDIKHVWLLFCTYYIAWILGDEGRGEMVTTPGPSCGPSAPGVDPPVCCVLAVTYVRGSFCWLLAPGLQFLSGGGRHHGTGLTAHFCISGDMCYPFRGIFNLSPQKYKTAFQYRNSKQAHHRRHIQVTACMSWIFMQCILSKLISLKKWASCHWPFD